MTFSRPLLDRTRPPHDHSRLLHDFNPTTTPISTRPSRPLHDLYSTNSTTTRPDQIDLVVQGSWGIGRIEVELIGYWSVIFFYTDQTISLHDRKKMFSDQLDLYSTNTRSLPDGFLSAWLLDLYSNFWTCPKFSGRKPERCPDHTNPTTPAERARPVPDRSIGLDRVDLTSNGNLP